MSTTVPVSEVEKDFALYHDRALTEPVRVVRDGQETVYIVSARDIPTPEAERVADSLIGEIR